MPPKFALRFYFDQHEFAELVLAADDLMNRRTQIFADATTQDSIEVNMQSVRYVRVTAMPIDAPAGWRVGAAYSQPMA